MMPRYDRSRVMRKVRIIDRSEITSELIRELFDYCPDTGVVTWKKRSPRHFSGNNADANCAGWNTKYAGKKAGAISSYGYYVVVIKYRQLQLSTIAFAHYFGRMPNGELDHIDCNPLNNSISNLRECSRSENAANRKIQSNNKSGLKGAYFINGKWRSYICINKKNYNLGTFNTAQQAHEAWLNAAKNAFGAFHRSA